MFTNECRLAAKEKVNCRYCGRNTVRGGLKAHEGNCIKNPLVEQKRRKECPVCLGVHYKQTITCSRSCSNTKFRSGKNNGNFITGKSTYKEVCFKNYGKKCIVCGESNVVDAHHLNRNRQDNRKENLVPLCPTHHRYCHSEFRSIVEPFIKEFKEKYRL